MKKIAIIGSGVVGQATGKGLIDIGHDVVFCDINPRTLAKLNEQGYHVCDPESLKKIRNDFYFLTVSTPTSDNKIELNFLESAVANLGNVLKKQDNYCLIIIRSTVPPGTTEDILIPILEKYSGKKAGKDFGACMNPWWLL